MKDKVVDFVIVTALAEERDAVLNKLPGYRQLSPNEEDIRTYYQADLPVIFPDGSSGTYQIIVTCLIGMGRVQAVTSTMDAIRQWHPRYILLVGIAGGMACCNIRIGDIVIADQIIDYELQKLTVNGTQVRWEIQRTDAKLLEACINFRDESWHNSIVTERPLPGKSYRYIGPIASGDKVIAFPTVLTEYLKMWPKLIGVEMEAAGVATAAFQTESKPGFFMVRGVSDLADENKDSCNVKEWRLYACEVAASFTIAFLRSGPTPLAKKTILGDSARVELILDGNFKEFTLKRQHDTVKILALLLDIDPGDIRVLKVQPGSILITLDIPKNAAELLYEMWIKHDIRLFELGIQSLSIKDRKIIELDSESIRIIKNEHERFPNFLLWIRVVSAATIMLCIALIFIFIPDLYSYLNGLTTLIGVYIDSTQNKIAGILILAFIPIAVLLIIIALPKQALTLWRWFRDHRF